MLPSDALLSQKLGRVIVLLFGCMRSSTANLWTEYFAALDEEGGDDGDDFARYRELHVQLVGADVEENRDRYAFEDDPVLDPKGNNPEQLRRAATEVN